MLTENLNKLFTRDLDGLINELNLYKNENDLWTVYGDITNSAGNLALHLIGNLQHFIGKELGGTNYVRTREREFSLKNVSRETIIKQIEDTKIMVNKTLKTLDTNKLQDQYPILVFKENTSTEFFLMHLSSHLSYHLGQINYHRRLMNF